MATPSYATVIGQINTFIVANGNNEITANVLNPILDLITDFANNHMGDLGTLTTDETDNLVEAINSLKQNIEDITGNSVQLYEGVGDPNDTPPTSFNDADFFMQISPIDNEPIQLWQFDGFNWVEVGNSNESGTIVAESFVYDGLDNTFVVEGIISTLIDVQIENGCNYDNYATIANGNEVTIDTDVVYSGNRVKIIYTL
jgi:hypothetical protein